MTLSTRSEEAVRRLVRRALPVGAYRMGARLLDAVGAARRIGWRQYRQIVAAGRPSRSNSRDLVRLAIPGLRGPFVIRPGTTDGHTVLQTLGRASFARLAPAGPVRFIVDAGANIGDTAVWFLARYPDAFVVAIEPDRENAGLLRRNTAMFEGRVRIVEAALWTAPASLQVVRTTREDGFRVAPATDGEGMSCPAVTMADVLSIAGSRLIDIFKCDIEGAEEQLFAGDCDWITRTRTIYVESHTERAGTLIRQAANRHGRVVTRYREWLVLTP